MTKTNTCFIIKDQNNIIISYRHLPKTALINLTHYIPANYMLDFTYLLLANKINLDKLPDFNQALVDDIYIYKHKQSRNMLINQNSYFDPTYTHEIMSLPYSDLTFHLQDGSVFSFTNDTVPTRSEVKYIETTKAMHDEITTVNRETNSSLYWSLLRKETLKYSVFSKELFYLVPDIISTQPLTDLSTDLITMVKEENPDIIINNFFIFDVNTKQVLRYKNEKFKTIKLNPTINESFHLCYKTKWDKSTATPITNKPHKKQLRLFHRR